MWFKQYCVLSHCTIFSVIYFICFICCCNCFIQLSFLFCLKNLQTVATWKYVILIQLIKVVSSNILGQIKFMNKKKNKHENMPCTVTQTCHPRTQEAETGGLMRPTWGYTMRTQPAWNILKTLSQNKQKLSIRI